MGCGAEEEEGRWSSKDRLIILIFCWDCQFMMLFGDEIISP